MYNKQNGNLWNWNTTHARGHEHLYSPRLDILLSCNRVYISEDFDIASLTTLSILRRSIFTPWQPDALQPEEKEEEEEESSCIRARARAPDDLEATENALSRRMTHRHSPACKKRAPRFDT